MAELLHLLVAVNQNQDNTMLTAFQLMIQTFHGLRRKIRCLIDNKRTTLQLREGLPNSLRLELVQGLSGDSGHLSGEIRIRLTGNFQNSA